MATFIDELTRMLSHLNDAGPTRPQAEAHLNELFIASPSNVLLALITIGGGETTEGILRQSAYVLFRRMAFRPLPGSTDPTDREVWENVDDGSKVKLQAGLLRGLNQSGSRSAIERSSICDAIASVANAGSKTGSDLPLWRELSFTLNTLFHSPMLTLRESTFKIYTEVPSLLASESTATVVSGLTAGLNDPSIGVRLAALSAATAVICNAEVKQLNGYSPLVLPMLQLLPQLAEDRSESRLTQALFSLIDLAATPKVPARLLRPHLTTLLSFCLSLITPSPYQFSPTYSATPFDETVRAPAVELLICLAETAPNMVKSHLTYLSQVVEALLDLMIEKEDSDWLASEDLLDEENESLAVVGEGGIDRLSRALGNDVFAPTMRVINERFLFSPVWQLRYAGFSSIASVCEGCIDMISDNLAPIVFVIIKAMGDKQPEVVYSAIYAIGQLCTDLEGALQESHGRDILQALIIVTKSPHPRLQAYSAACLVNFFQSCDPEPLHDLLSVVFDSLVRLLSQGKLFVKENAIEALTLVSRSMQDGFDPLYPRIMPDLLNLFETVSGSDDSMRNFRAKALDCASTIADSVSSTVFAPDAPRLLAAMRKIGGEIDEEDDITLRYLLRAYSQLAASVGPATFAPYVSEVLPHLVEEAQRKSETLMGDDVDLADDEFETVEVEGQGRMAIRTSALEDKLEAVENLVMLVQALSTSLPAETLEALIGVGLDLLTFYYHIGVREAAASLVAITIQGLSMAVIPHDRLQLIFDRVAQEFISCISLDSDAEILYPFLTSFNSCIASVPRGTLLSASRQAYIKAIESQLTLLRNREADRGNDLGDADDVGVWDDESVEIDAAVLHALSRSITVLLKDDSAGFPIQLILPFLTMINDASPNAVQFSLKLLHGLIKYCSNVVGNVVQHHLQRVLSLLLDLNPDTRGHAAAVVGIAAESSPAQFVDFCLAAIPSLFESIGPIDMDDNDILAARDKSISALAQIIPAYGSDPRIDLETTLPKWVNSLPILVDGDEAESVCSLLMQLISSGHPCVLPTSPAAKHVTKVLVSLLQSEIVPLAIQMRLAATLKLYIQPDVLPTLPHDVQRMLGGDL